MNTENDAVLAALAFARAVPTDEIEAAYDRLLPHRLPNEGVWECALRILANRIAPVRDTQTMLPCAITGSSKSGASQTTVRPTAPPDGTTRLRRPC